MHRDEVRNCRALGKSLCTLQTRLQPQRQSYCDVCDPIKESRYKFSTSDLDLDLGRLCSLVNTLESSAFDMHMHCASITDPRSLS